MGERRGFAGGFAAAVIVTFGAMLGLAQCATSTEHPGGDASTDAALGKDAGSEGGLTDGSSSSDATRDVAKDVVEDVAQDATQDVAADVAIEAATDAATTRALVFTTSQTYTGAMGGLSGADAICQSLAGNANLPGTYKAWLSDQTNSPSTRFTHSSVPYTLVDGTVVANNWTDLISGTLQHAIDKSESNGSPGKDNSGLSLPSGVTLVWTSTKFDGTSVTNTTCQNWTSSSSSDPSEWGRDDSTNAYWTQWASSGSCGWVAPLMCFQQ